MKEFFSALIGKVGCLVEEGLQHNMLITFNDQAPLDYLDYVIVISDICYGAETLSASSNYFLILNNNSYPITCWGGAAWNNLCQLGHVAVMFDGAIEALSYGTLHVASAVPPDKNDLIGSFRIIRA